MKELSDIPSELLTQALDDLEKAESHPDYCVNMWEWHSGKSSRQGSPCHVCLAGAVMAFSLDVSVMANRLPPDFPPADGDKLLALDKFRLGSVDGALSYMNIPEEKVAALPETLLDFFVPDYDIAPDEFKAQLRDIATRLKEAGL